MYYPHIFAGNPLDRGERERRDEDWIVEKANDPQSKFLPMRDLNVLINDGEDASLAWVSIEDLRQLEEGFETVLLGMLDGIAHFVVDVSGSEALTTDLQDTAARHFQECRSVAEMVSGQEAGILAQARAQLDWNTRHSFCSVCGHKTEKRRGGQARQCPSCKAQHFPRTDPVIIVVVTDGERALLGQSRGRLSRMNTYSALAGFMDQGENIEEAVAREVMEEAGIQVGEVRYHSSQPWLSHSRRGS